MGEKNNEKIYILYFVNRLLSPLLSPSILHTVLSYLQYPYTEHPKIIIFRYPTDILEDPRGGHGGKAVCPARSPAGERAGGDRPWSCVAAWSGLVVILYQQVAGEARRDAD